MVQQRLLKALKGEKPESMMTDEWEELKARAVNTIRLYLASEIKYSTLNEKIPLHYGKNQKRFIYQNF